MPRKLLFSLHKDDFDWSFFSSGGPGGQNQNKRSTGVRVLHPPSGAKGESRTARTQHGNRQLALRRLAETPQFRLWARKIAYKLPDIEKIVEGQMKEENLQWG